MRKKHSSNDDIEKVEKPKRNIKKRNWAFVLYPESAPDDWKQKLIDTGLPIAISPLHDKDVDPTGEPKKPHHHIILMYNGPTSYDVVKKITDDLNQPRPMALESVRGNYRYFTHKDNPDKFQYDEKDITALNGFNILDFVELTKSEVNTILRKLQQMVRDLDIIEYSDLMDILLDSDAYNEYDVASSHTFFFEKYISSRRNKSVRISDSKNSKKSKKKGVENVSSDAS